MRTNAKTQNEKFVIPNPVTGGIAEKTDIITQKKGAAAMITERSYAKLNLTLDVTGLLPGGYHALRSVMQSTDFGDELTIEPGGTEWRAESNLKYLPTGAANLAVRAALLFREVTGKGPEAALIRISKNIPVCGGLAGGSGNAAAVLRAMNREFGGGLSEEELRRLGGKLGSDIPFCVSGGTMLAEGRGEILSPLPPMPAGKNWLTCVRISAVKVKRHCSG